MQGALLGGSTARPSGRVVSCIAFVSCSGDAMRCDAMRARSGARRWLARIPELMARPHKEVAEPGMGLDCSAPRKPCNPSHPRDVALRGTGATCPYSAPQLSDQQSGTDAKWKARHRGRV